MNQALLRLVATLGLLFVGFAAAGELQVGDKAKVRIRDLAPTQFSAGMKEVESRENTIALKRAEGGDALKEYMKGKRKLAAIGPGGQLYLVDGHHLALALYRSGIESIYIKIVADYSHLSEAEFWAKVNRKGYAYLRDEQGHLRPASQLPSQVSGLKDDPYRSLAWWLETLGAFEKIERPFHEFEWAELLRREMSSLEDPFRDWEEAVKAGWKIARGPTARRLPGYLGRDADPCFRSWKQIGLRAPKAG